jgi:DNA-binding NtrC family response regulator
MTERLFALLIHEEAKPFEALRRTLCELSIDTHTVSTCQEAARLISHRRPDVIFTESAMKDGSWADVLNLARRAGVLLSVIVVAAQADMPFYLSVMERGAFDFLVPPFEHESLDFVVKTAARSSYHLGHPLSRAAEN